jgi:16S rRNA (guanine527-N7)-methyltransferase
LSVETSRSPANESELGDRIAVGASQLGVPLSTDQIERLDRYLRLIQRWNATYNLTAVRDPDAMVSLHILDCLAAAAALGRRRGGGGGERVIDVGSGAGLPGLILASVFPERTIVCVDSVGKKAAFITQAASVLGLSNVTALHARVEGITDRPFDVITSRAFASLGKFVVATRHLLAEGGTWMAMKGGRPEQELSELAELISRGLSYEVEPLSVPSLSAKRCLIWLSAGASAGL